MITILSQYKKVYEKMPNKIKKHKNRFNIFIPLSSGLFFCPRLLTKKQVFNVFKKI